MTSNDKPIAYQKVGNIDFGLQTEVRHMALSFEDNIAGALVGKTKIGNKLAANIKMNNGIKYIIILVNTTTNHSEFIGQATVGESLEIDAVKGESYNWYAYSYNTTADIQLPTSIDDEIDTPIDKELLYAKGTTTISTTTTNTPIPIIFQHKLSEIVFELDTDRLFGEINNDLVLEFVDGNPLSKGKFSLKTGQTNNIIPYTKPIVLQNDPVKENVKIARFYVVDISKTPSFSINVSNMKVTYLNNVQSGVVAPNTTRKVEFNWGENARLGKRYIGKLKLWYVFPKRTILHVTRTGTELYGYAAQPYSANGTTLTPDNNKAAYNLIAEPKNYGSLLESVVRSGGFDHIRCYQDGTLYTFLANKPDIVIISVYYQMSSEDRSSLITYLNQGGVLLLLTDGVNAGDRNAQQPFFRDFFNNQTITLQNTGYSSGALYKMVGINDEILNGPFGDVRDKYWGEDASATTSLSNVPSTEVTQYSAAKAANGTTAANGITMFKHNTKNFFWIGDGGFLSNELSRGIYSSYTIEPFATVNLSQSGSTNPVNEFNYNNYPIPKKYGYSGNGISVGTTDVYNSTVFANIMSWAVINAEFFGINSGGLKELPSGIKNWEVSTGIVNINF